jgi:DNA adenine methylase
MARWKKKTIQQIKAFLPETFLQKNDIIYVEPFVGGGALLFWILQNLYNIKRTVINDLNEVLINTYRVVKDNPAQLLEKLQIIEHEIYTLDKIQLEKYYYKKRQELNEDKLDNISAAAVFIFLNHFCFRGFFLSYKDEKFSTVFDNSKTSKAFFYNKKNILKDSEILKKVEILNTDFAETLKYANNNSFYFLDPPYRPLSKNKNKIDYYTKEGFADADQIRLRDFCKNLDEQGAKFLQVNSDCDFIRDLYKNFYLEKVTEITNLSCVNNKRKNINSLFIYNYKK